MPATNGAPTLAQIGTVYNAIAGELLGGVSPVNQQLLLNQVKYVQNGVQTLIDNGSIPAGASQVHAQNVADQMDFLHQQISQYNTNPYAAKYINDVVRDVQDIVRGDDALAKMAGSTGFQQVSNLLKTPTPYPDNQVQTETLKQFITDSNNLASRGEAVAKGGTDATLIQDIQNFTSKYDAYSQSQDGLFTARFNNELASHGVQGTAAKELIAGLQTHNKALINGAAEVLNQNAADVASNMSAGGTNVAQGSTLAQIGAVKTVHDAGIIFNDATTKLIGGAYVGTTVAGAPDPGNKAGIVADLQATATGLQNAISNQQLTGKALADANKVIGLLGHEANLINNATGQVSLQNTAIGVDHAAILKIVNHDATLHDLTTGVQNFATAADNVGDTTTGFSPLPPTKVGQALVAGLGNGNHDNAMSGGHGDHNGPHNWNGKGAGLAMNGDNAVQNGVANGNAAGDANVQLAANAPAADANANVQLAVNNATAPATAAAPAPAAASAGPAAVTAGQTTAAPAATAQAVTANAAGVTATIASYTPGQTAAAPTNTAGAAPAVQAATATDAGTASATAQTATTPAVTAGAASPAASGATAQPATLATLDTGAAHDPIGHLHQHVDHFGHMWG